MYCTSKRYLLSSEASLRTSMYYYMYDIDHNIGMLLMNIIGALIIYLCHMQFEPS
jgi:hypothetical protein